MYLNLGISKQINFGRPWGTGPCLRYLRDAQLGMDKDTEIGDNIIPVPHFKE